MKALLFVLSLIGILHATQDDLTPIQVLAAQETIKASGYKCDTVDGKPFFSDGYNSTIEISCNNRYRYVLTDVGGRWMVKVK